MERLDGVNIVKTHAKSIKSMQKKVTKATNKKKVFAATVLRLPRALEPGGSIEKLPPKTESI